MAGRTILACVCFPYCLKLYKGYICTQWLSDLRHLKRINLANGKAMEDSSVAHHHCNPRHYSMGLCNTQATSFLITFARVVGKLKWPTSKPGRVVPVELQASTTGTTQLRPGHGTGESNS